MYLVITPFPKGSRSFNYMRTPTTISLKLWYIAISLTTVA